jgi:hypothetical protein
MSSLSPKDRVSLCSFRADSALQKNLRSEEPAFSGSRADHSLLITHHFPKPKDRRLCHLPNFPLPLTTPPATLFVTRDPASIPPYPSADQTPLIPATQCAQSAVPAARPDNPPRTGPAHPLRNLPQIGSPAHSTSTTLAASA